MQLFHKIMVCCSPVRLSTYSILMKNLLAAGKWRKCIEVSLSLSPLLSDPLFSMLFCSPQDIALYQHDYSYFFLQQSMFFLQFNCLLYNFSSLQVLQWMEDGGIQPPMGMYRSVMALASRENSMEHVNMLRLRISMLCTYILRELM